MISVHLADPGGTPVPAAQPGQFLSLRLRPGHGAHPLLRSYSLSGDPGANTYRISVEEEARAARAGQPVHPHQIAVMGDLVEAPPRGALPSSWATATAPVLLISAGVGATPVLAMLHALATAKSRP